MKVNDTLDTKFFSIRRTEEGSGVVSVDGMMVNFLSGEEVYQNRVYSNITKTVFLLVVSKIKDQSIFVSLSFIDNQNNPLLMDDLGWFDESIYEDSIQSLEKIILQNGFSLDKVVPGRLYNVYFSTQGCK